LRLFRQNKAKPEPNEAENHQILKGLSVMDWHFTPVFRFQPFVFLPPQLQYPEVMDQPDQSY
jgi:hypothetical protein